MLMLGWECALNGRIALRWSDSKVGKLPLRAPISLQPMKANFYWVDLLGAQVINQDQVVLGEVVGFPRKPHTPY